jgi:hypothetical protein
VGKVVRLEKKVFSSIAGRGGSIAGERIGNLTLMGERFPSMEQREVEKFARTISSADLGRREGETAWTTPALQWFGGPEAWESRVGPGWEASPILTPTDGGGGVGCGGRDPKERT